jgi:hypothetical protein
MTRVRFHAPAFNLLAFELRGDFVDRRYGEGCTSSAMARSSLCYAGIIAANATADKATRDSMLALTKWLIERVERPENRVDRDDRRSRLSTTKIACRRMAMSQRARR